MSVAKPIAHDSGLLHVTGAARYIDDIALPANALHLAFGLSTVAHGEISAIDLSEVRAAPGVRNNPSVMRSPSPSRARHRADRDRAPVAWLAVGIARAGSRGARTV